MPWAGGGTRSSPGTTARERLCADCLSPPCPTMACHYSSGESVLQIHLLGDPLGNSILKSALDALDAWPVNGSRLPGSREGHHCLRLLSSSICSWVCVPWPTGLAPVSPTSRSGESRTMTTWHWPGVTRGAHCRRSDWTCPNSEPPCLDNCLHSSECSPSIQTRSSGPKRIHRPVIDW